MDLSTKYLGIDLKNPLIVSSSKLTKEFDSIKFCAEMGAGAIVTKSIFEEQLLTDNNRLKDQDQQYFWYPEAIDLINKHSKEYGLKKLLDLINTVKAKLDIPVIASINCVTDNEWPNFASVFEEAGADALELNIAIIPFDKYSTCSEINERYLDILRNVKKHVKIPVSVKLGSYFTNIIGMANKLDKEGADGLVLFNRFYRPDINIETEEIVNTNILSGPSEATRALRWIALLSHQLECDISAGTGIHDYNAMVKQLLVGADAVQICSTLFRNGISYIETILFELQKWMKRRGYNSVSEFQGKIHKMAGEEIAKFERIQFLNREH
ncbi:MAG TPA: dihydroorotate dehydrogenase-like protein [Bacteroidetes bacterium]|nr:dihydroorotate dehydrogenase-like protein [Bacteroidota bacterium]